MDRTTVRIILLIIGIIVIAGVYFWHQYQAGIRAWFDDLLRGGRAAYDDEFSEADDSPYEEYLDEYDTPSDVPAYTRANSARASVSRPHEEPRERAPDVVQLSVVAVENSYFSGNELMDAFHYVGLRYGEMGIFHHYDANNEIEFSAASIVEPGTFPVSNMADFKCPGVVLFFQTNQVADPLETFDGLVSCCHELAIRLNGVEWDAWREPLSTESIAALRSALS